MSTQWRFGILQLQRFFYSIIDEINGFRDNNSQVEPRYCYKSDSHMCPLTQHHGDEIPLGPPMDPGRGGLLSHYPHAIEKWCQLCRYRPTIKRKPGYIGNKDTNTVT